MATIGIDVTALSTSASGGIGASQYETMRALERAGSRHRFIMYAAVPPVVPFTDIPLDLGWQLRLGSGLTARSNIVWMQTGINRMLAEDGVDLFWSPRHLLPFRARGTAMVATIQDFWHLHYPEQQPLWNRTMNRLLIERILRVADHVVTTSRATAEDASRFYGIRSDRMTIVPLGVDGSVFTAASQQTIHSALDRLGIHAPFVLAMDVYNPRKNFATVLQAVSLLAEAHGDLQVVGLGRRRDTASDADPAGIAERLGIESRVILPGDVPLADLIALYSGAAAFVYPSVFEGFGMPVLEAMACGCPVITSDRSSLPEVAGDAALLVDPTDARAAAHAIGRVLADGTATGELISKGRARAASFSWDATALGMLDVFDRVLSSRPARRG